MVSSANAHKQHEQQTTVLIGAQYSMYGRSLLCFDFRRCRHPGISALSVIRCIAVRPPHGWAAARRPVLEKSYTRILKHVTVDPFANPCSPHSCRCRCCVYFTPHIFSSKSKTIFQTAYFPQYELAGCANLIAFPPWSNTSPTRP